MYTLFISDLHLAPDRPQLTAIFLQFLTTQAAKADALYILGDFFEVWLGDDVTSGFTQTICAALKTLTAAGTRVYLMHGNRDFLLGRQFLAATGCALLPDPTRINLYGVPVLLMHGDTLCWQDTAYLRFRQLVRNPCYQWLFLHLPLFIRQRIARYLRRQSRQKNKSMAAIQLSDAASEAIVEAIQTYKADLIIHGHTHRPCLQWHNAAPVFKRVVLSDWETCGNALVYSPDHTYRLLYFD